MTEALIEGEKMRQELEMARAVQMSTLPAVMPSLPGYDLYGTSRPASLTGGDTFDLALLDQGLLTVLGDATGHGIAPALSVTQMHAMLRMAFRLGADLETAFLQVNNQLAATIADDRFITAFIGLLDASTHRMRFHSGGQAPILHYQAAHGDCARYNPTSFPLAAMPLSALRPAVSLDLLPGDILALLSDGIYEYCDRHNEQFGEDRVEAVAGAPTTASRWPSSRPCCSPSVETFAQGAPQEDDITIVLVKREAERDGGAVLPSQLRFARGDLRVHLGISSPPTASTAGSCPRSTWPSRSSSRTWSSTAPRATPSSASRWPPTPGGVEVTLTDYDVDRFDVTEAPDADINLPIEERKPGGLGLHLIRRLVDSLHYEYSSESRQSRTTFRKTQSGRPVRAARRTEGDRECWRSISVRTGAVVIAGRLDAAQCPGRPGVPRARRRAR